VGLKLNQYTSFGSLIATLCIVIPAVFILGAGLLEIINQLTWIIENQGQVISSLFDFAQGLNIPPSIEDRILESLWNVSTSILPMIANIGIVAYAFSIVVFVINFLISIFVCYFLLRDGEKMYDAVIEVTPSGYEPAVKRYFYHLDMILSGIFIGNAYAAIFVSIISLIVFYAFGFSHILALATLIFVASVIPMFAGYMVLVPMALWRYFTMGIESALLFFAVSSIVIYAPPELILRPYLASIRSHVHPLLIMLSFLGGAFVGGIAGFFAAPILLAALMAAYRVYVEFIRKSNGSIEAE
jgi:predicted PurR-regulated permease PerM